MQRVVDELDVLAQVEKFVRLHRLLQRPVVVVGVKDAGFGHDPGVFEGGSEQFQFIADLADFLEDARVAFEVVRQQRAEEFFIADARLPPAIIKDAAGAARNELVGEQPDDAGPHERIDVLPVDLAGLLFDDPETAIAVGRPDVRLFQRAQHVNVAGQFGGFGLDGGVAFNGDKIHGVGHVEVIEFAAERAQVDGDGMVGAKFVQDIGLHPDEGDDGVAAKTVPIQQQRGIVRRLAHAWASAPGQRRKPPVPNSASPAVVEALDGFVFQLEPVLPFQARIFVERPFGLMSAEAAVNLPGDELGMVAQRLGHVFDDAFGSNSKKRRC